MRRVSFQQLLALSDTPKGSFNVQLRDGETALAFGSIRPLVGGVYLDLDAIAMLLVDELAAAFGRKFASTIVRGHGDTWLAGVGLVDITQEQVFFAVAEYGEMKRHKAAGGRILRGDNIRLAITTMTFDRGAAIGSITDKVATYNREAEIPARITWVNLTDIVGRVRNIGRQIGLDLEAPFFPPETDPEAYKMLAAAREGRQAMLAWFEREKASAGLAGHG